MFWLCDDWDHGRVRVHRTGCVECRDVHGHETHTNEMWLHFGHYEEAATAARRLGRLDTADCARCHPGIRELDGALRFEHALL